MAAAKPRKKPRRPAKSAKTAKKRWQFRPWRWLLRTLSIVFLAAVFVVIFYAIINPPTTIYMMQEKARLGSLDYEWVPLENVAPVMARSAVAAEDANFCNHWGIDMKALRAAIEAGGNRGASTISQQVVKNVYLWHGRSWVRKAMEALMTPLVEAVWSKRRILEVYLNVAEFDEGIFGVEAAARHYFGIGPEKLTATQAARLAAILPSPKTRSASRPSKFVQRRAARIRDGAATIAADGRAGCFEN